MRALVYGSFGGLEVLNIGEVSTPEIADDEVLIRVRAGSINPFDWKLRRGLLRGFFDVKFPITAGRDGCGHIVSLGRSVARGDASLRFGQRVSFVSSRLQHGALAEYVAVKAQGSVAPAADNMSDEQCAALPLVGISAWNAVVETADVQPGMRVLIHGGSGGIGGLAIQLARSLGAEVYATCSAAKTGTVEDLGATAIPYNKVDFAGAVSDCDVVVDTVGGEVHEKSYTVLKKGGRLVYLIARPFRDRSGDFEVQTRQVIVSNKTESLQQVMALAGKGRLTTKIGRTLPLVDFRDAFRFAESGRAGGKVVLEISGAATASR